MQDIEDMITTNKIHSVIKISGCDGPGNRMVIFTQGCVRKCRFCLNPDTWEIKNLEEVKINDIFTFLKEKIGLYKPNEGGITISGGEPLMHIDLCIELATKARQIGLTTAIDTAGLIESSTKQRNNLKKLFDNINFLMISHKFCENQKYYDLTGYNQQHFFDFMDFLYEYLTVTRKDDKLMVIFRYILIPDETNTDEELTSFLENFYKFKSFTKYINILPYTNIGKKKLEKYKILDNTFKLPTKEEIIKVVNFFTNKGYKVKYKF